MSAQPDTLVAPLPGSRGFAVHLGPGYEIAVADWIAAARALPDDSVNMIVTSVPYWGLRDYGVAGQLGLEASVDDWLAVQVRGFAELRRILHPSGTCWVNCGDAYAQTMNLEGSRRNMAAGRAALEARGAGGRQIPKGYKPKDLLQLPARLAWALQQDGWYLRQEVVWSKPNPMPESIKDRPTKSHEMVYMLSKERTYYYDAEAVREPYKPASIARRESALSALAAGRPNDSDVGDRIGARRPSNVPRIERADGDVQPDGRSVVRPPNDGTAYAPNPSGRNRRDVWPMPDTDEAFLAAVDERMRSVYWWQALDDVIEARADLATVLDVATARFAGNHTATYPPDLIEPMIKAGTSERGVCPECRAPWKRVVSKGALDLEHAKACGSDAQGEYHGESTKDYGAAGAQDASATKARILAGMRMRRTTGWRPTCGCSPLFAPFVEFLRSGRIAFPSGDTLDIMRRLIIEGPGGSEQHRDVACADPSCSHPLRTHGPGEDACGRCRCRCFRWGDPYAPDPAVVYDPFMGMATSALVAIRLGRRAMGSELSPDYARDAVARLEEDALSRTFGAEIAKNGTASEKAAAASQGRLFE